MARMLARVVLLFCALLPSVASGQYYDWGRSPQGMRWMQAKLPSGKVVFPDYYSDNAARVARYLDTIRPSISYGFEYAPLKMPVVLHTENFVANGMAMWAPKRIELEMIPDAQPFAEPWLKHLVTHEYRHAVQYGNLYRRFMKGLGYVLGQQAGFVSSVLVPVWFLEGDAGMAETQMSSFGRALQPSFTVEYRAYLTEGKQRFPLDKWFCGSYRNYIPDHYQFGYQLVAWSRERYGDDMWSRVADYGARRPYTILTTKWALRKYYRTSVNRIARSTLDDLTRFWRSQPVEPNSASILPTPLTSYTVYRSPMRLDGSTLLALKKDMDRPNRLVAVDLATGRERRIAWTGSVNTPPVLGDSGGLPVRSAHRAAQDAAQERKRSLSDAASGRPAGYGRLRLYGAVSARPRRREAIPFSPHDVGTRSRLRQPDSDARFYRAGRRGNVDRSDRSRERSDPHASEAFLRQYL